MISPEEKRKARELAAQILFQNEFSKEWNISEAIKYFSPQPNKNVSKYAHFLLDQVKSHIEEIDKKIESNSQNWKISRINLVDLSILRVALGEMLYTSTPPKAIIDEAIEVAKKYSTTDSAAFINGILDQVYKNSSLYQSEEPS